MRFRRGLTIVAAIYIVWVALTVGELWPLHRVFDVPAEYWHDVFFRDLFDGTRVDISPREAHLLWVIRDPEPADGTFDTFTRNFSAMLRRATPLELPVVIPLDLLMLPFGESFVLLRLIAMAAAGIIVAAVAYIIALPFAAAVWRWLQSPSRGAIIAAGAFGCFGTLCCLSLLGPRMCYFGVSDQMHLGLSAYLSEHVAGDPVITLFGEDSRFAHFAATQDLRLANRIDLSQRLFTAAEIDGLIAGIEADRVWVMFERGEPLLDRNYTGVMNALEAGDRGKPFIRGPGIIFNVFSGAGESISEQDLNDSWRIAGYDANFEDVLRLGPDIPSCWKPIRW
jgi:hypothetical protein